MVKNILAVIAGYLVMALLVFSAFTAAYALLGPDGAFQPGSFKTSTTWLVVSVLVSLLAALIGGWVCVKIAKQAKMVYLLAAVIIVLGLIFAFPVLTAKDTATDLVREGPVSNSEAMQKATQPAWIVLANPLLGAVGVLIGGRRKKAAA